MRPLCAIAAVVALFVMWAETSLAADKANAPRLPLPAARIPPLPRLRPTVVTAAGQRLLLAYTDVAVSWDAANNRLGCNRPGWWIINFPLRRIRGMEGQTDDQIAKRLFDRPASEIRNWYLKVPGQPTPEPPSPTGPAPIECRANPTLVVDAGNPAAQFKTIQAALDKARPGDVVRIMPGIYRESIAAKQAGTRDKPIVIEGMRDAQGNMPVITGNDPFPANAWRPAPDAPGVYRADLFTRLPGTVSVNGNALIERSYYRELEPGEYCLNLATREANAFRVPADAKPSAGDALAGMTWTRLEADAEGFLDLARLPGGAAPNSVYYAFAYVWVEPKKVKETWDPRFPQPITKRVDVPGDFRAARQTGSPLRSQLNFYRVWCNGDRVPSVVYMTPDIRVAPPHPTRNYGQKGDRIESFVMRQGWNRLLLQLDTSRKPKRTRLKFNAPKGIDQFVCATRPAAGPPEPTKPAPYVTEWLVLGPFRSEPDDGVYVRLRRDADPNRELVDLAARSGPLVKIERDYVHLRGLEVRQGAAFQQRPLVAVQGAGCLVEGCLVRDSEVSGISASNPRDQRADPTVVRGNWIVNTGHTGMGAQHSSTELTPANQTDPAPGRGRLVIEHNAIRLTNWAAHPCFWASGGMKLFRLTGAVIRYNRIEDCFGPGIWLDWEHYNNRLEGNLITNNWSFGIGIEASPGPNLVCNNLFVAMRPGSVWFRWNILDWSTARTMAVNNTIDGKWCDWPCWFNRKGTDGIFIGCEGGPDRHTRWQPLGDDRGSVAVNNLVLGCARAVHKGTVRYCAHNFTNRGSGAQPLGARPKFIAATRFDYRLDAADKLNALGIADSRTDLVKHDFYGLLRRCAKRSVGAFRAEPAMPTDKPTVEIELVSGEVVVR